MDIRINQQITISYINKKHRDIVTEMVNLLPTDSPNEQTVGEFRKTHHPRNVKVTEICDASFQG
jgi:hypothetical protein